MIRRSAETLLIRLARARAFTTGGLVVGAVTTMLGLR